MADGLGFEPKTALRLYSISSAAPSTGLGHPSSDQTLAITARSLGEPRISEPDIQDVSRAWWWQRRTSDSRHGLGRIDD